jgi:hypothetical protein
MDYQNYIDLGFERTDLNDTVEFKETGYYGFCLEKRINDKMLVSVCSGELDKPKLYIQKAGQECYHIIPITPEMVAAIFND